MSIETLPTRLFPILYVDDLPRSLAFYRDLLHLHETYRFPATGDPAFITLALRGDSLGLGTYEPVPGLEARDLRRPAGGRGFELCVYVDDVDDTVARLRDEAVRVLVEPVDQPWGERLAYVQDPDGNTVMLTAAAASTGGMDPWQLQPIGAVRSPFADVDRIPKGPGARHDAEGVLELRPDLEPGLEDIEGFSHLFVVWVFHRATGFELLGRPPTDDRPHGVFATRSPRRPNPIGLTVVELLGRDGPRLRVRGLDMLDGTPILDIKPYLSSVPAERLRRGWLAEAEARGHRDTSGDGPPPGGGR